LVLNFQTLLKGLEKKKRKDFASGPADGSFSRFAKFEI
jgi:hypothetical protein